MCGIAGLLHFDELGNAGARTRRMADANVHRGPDDEGYRHFAGCSLERREDLQPASIRRKFEDHLAGRADNVALICSLISFATWRPQIDMLDGAARTAAE